MNPESRRLGHRGFEAKRALHERHVVVDGFRDADDADAHAPPHRFLADLLRPAKGSVAADGEQDPDPEIVQVRGHFPRVLMSSRGAEDRTATLVDGMHRFRRQLERLVSNPAYEPFIAETEAVDLVHAVMETQAPHDRADDVVQPRAEAAARDDPARELGR